MQIFESTPEQLLGKLNDVERRNSPDQLYLAGDPRLIEQGARVSIVGSRRASEAGRRIAAELADAFVRHQMVVVSGLAEGIDTAAHEGTIAAGGRTVAVLGTPLDQAYPARNRDLLAQVIAEHLAVSQFPLGYPVRKQNFPMRNRTMALLTDATVIVEAGDKSGTLHQGWEALRLGRLLFLSPEVAKRPGLSWPAEMIRYGAQVLSAEALEQFLEELPDRSRGASFAL